MLLIACAFLLEACIKDTVASHTYISLIGKHDMAWTYAVATGCQQDGFKVPLAEWQKKDSDILRLEARLRSFIYESSSNFVEVSGVTVL